MTEPCACSQWVEGIFDFNIERDQADNRLTAFLPESPFPRRTAVSRSFVREMTEKIGPGAIESKRRRMVIRTTDGKETAYAITGFCEECKYILLERA